MTDPAPAVSLRLRASQVPPHLRKYFRAVKSRPKSLMGIPWRYALRCIDELGLILRAEIIWAKPNGLPESVIDRVRRSHEQWFHMVKQPRYYSAVDEIREEHSANTPMRQTVNFVPARGGAIAGDLRQGPAAREVERNPLGKLPGSVWTVPTQPLTVPPELGVDHFAAFPMEWPRRIIQGWSPAGVCVVCGEGRRPISEAEYVRRQHDRPGTRTQRNNGNNRDDAALPYGSSALKNVTITGYACACPEPTAPTRPAVILDPFMGTGTTLLVAKMLGRDSIGVDLSADYCRLATWRCSDPGQMASALQVERPDPISPDQLDLFAEEIAP